MQALIDFDGWRKWKDFSQQGALTEKEDAAKAKEKSKKKKANRMSLGSNSGSTSRLALAIKEEGSGPEGITVG